MKEKKSIRISIITSSVFIIIKKEVVEYLKLCYIDYSKLDIGFMTGYYLYFY